MLLFLAYISFANASLVYITTMSLQDDIAIILNTEVVDRVDCKELIQLLSSSRDMRKRILDIGVGQWQKWTNAIEHKAPADLDKQSQSGIKKWNFPVFDKVFANAENETEELEKKRRAANVFYANCLHNHLFKKYTGDTMKGKWYDAIIKKQQEDFENFAYFTNVESIGEAAFKYHGLTSPIIIPATVTHIESNAFFRNRLTSVDIPNGVTYLGNGAFYDNGLKSVSLPDSLKYISQYAFARNKLKSVSIPDSVKNIGDYAFYLNDLKSVSLPDSLKYISDSAFEKNQLWSVSIPDSVRRIGRSAFARNKLRSVSIPNGVTYIGNGAFTENTLKSVSIPDSVEYIGNGAFYDNGLESVSIPNGVTYIGQLAFKDNALISVSLPDSVEYIGESAFSRNELTSVSIGESTKVEDHAFDKNVKIIRRSTGISSALPECVLCLRGRLIGMQLEAALKF